LETTVIKFTSFVDYIQHIFSTPANCGPLKTVDPGTADPLASPLNVALSIAAVGLHSALLRCKHTVNDILAWFPCTNKLHVL